MAPIAAPTKPLSLAPDTLPVRHFTSQSSHRYLVQGRPAVLKDLKRYRRVPFPTLVDSAFGPPREISHIRQTLIDAGVLKVFRIRDKCISRWSNFITKPSEMNATESVTFAPLIAIISNIFGQISSCPFECSANPHAQLLSERENTSRPDAYINCSDPATKNKKGNHWFDVAVPFEFKKARNASGTQDNEWKMIWSLHNIMREDPLRRFTLGITIEDVNMRIWYHSRALLTVSEPINFTTAVDDVISLFYVIGSQTKVGLGWDPTVERIIPEGPGPGVIRFKFKIDNQYFITTRPLSTFGADAMVGRGTRVYEARDEDGNIVAIKDSWRDEDREPEGRILEMIFEDIRAKFGEKEAEKAERYFARVQAYEDVRISGETDKSLNPGEDGEWVDVDDQPILSERRHLCSIGHVPDFSHSPLASEALRRAPRQSDRIMSRIHARTVFRDVGVSLMDVTHLVDSFRCLSDSGRALYYLHKAGWVHRDFSVANVLWVKEGGAGIGKLSDFEFAKKVNSEMSHDVRTGTTHFMAVEVASQTYRFVPQDTEAVSNPPFRMNFLHDLESQWWAAMWILFYHTDTNTNSPTRALDEQQRSYHKAFPVTFNTAGRFSFFMLRTVLLQAHNTLSDTYRDQSKPVVDLARSLHDFYRKAEKTYPDISVNDDLLEEAHKTTSTCYSHVTQKLRELQTDLSLRPLQDSLGKKRPSENLGDLDLDVLPTKRQRSDGSCNSCDS